MLLSSHFEFPMFSVGAPKDVPMKELEQIALVIRSSFVFCSASASRISRALVSQSVSLANFAGSLGPMLMALLGGLW